MVDEEAKAAGWRRRDPAQVRRTLAADGTTEWRCEGRTGQTGMT